METNSVNVATDFKFDLSNGIIAAIHKNYGLMGDADGYKYSHAFQYPKGAQRMESYIESRGGSFNKVMMIGCQLLVLEYFTQRITMDQVDNIESFCKLYNAPFDRNSWETIVTKYDGYPPIEIKSIPEGTVVPTGNVLVTIGSSADDIDVFSVVSFFETKLLRLWSPCTVGTISYHIREYLLKMLNDTCDDPQSVIDTMLNDFGSRGTTGFEGSAFSGVGLLANFKGSDNTAAVLAANIAYQSDITGFTLPASEHSVVGSWLEGNELKMQKNMLDLYGNGSILASVSDTTDIEHTVKNIWGKELRQQIIDQNAILVVRPDSNHQTLMPIKVLEWLDEAFGHTVNNKGFKVLNHVRVIQGDGIEMNTILEIAGILYRKGYSIENMAFGMGGGLLQKNDRDTLKFACKCSAIKINDEWFDVYKNPVDASLWINADLTIGYEPSAVESFKKSKRGRLTLIQHSDTKECLTIRVDELELYDDNWSELLTPVFRNGKVLKVWTMDEVWANAHSDEVFVTK